MDSEPEACCSSPRIGHPQTMLFDVVFFGFPLLLGGCMACVALRDQETRFWRPAFCFFAYCAFYLAGGREVLLYLTVCLLVGGAWVDGGVW